jgi:1-acyl-sn-glycerol-3-phosphate acyltransferase
MQLTIELLAQMPLPLIRSGLSAWIAQHLDGSADERTRVQARVQACIDEASDEALLSMQAYFTTAGKEWRFYPANEVARRVTRAYMSALTTPWTLADESRLADFLAAEGRKLVVCNHLSYTDTQATDSVLALAGHAAFADRLVAIAGPKVYTEPWRRMAAIALNTRKTAQSSTVASEQDSMSPRELAMVALQTLADAERLMDEGYIILLYPEGTRSRDGRLQPFLRAAARYLAIDGLTVLPMAQTGGEALFPIEAERMIAGAVRIAFGESFQPAAFPGKTGALEEAHRRVSAELPERYRAEGGAVA